ncbi:MAG: ribonuclease H [Byssovorax sp.]
MPWVRAVLRNQKVFARANADGSLAVNNGKVEVRYKVNDGKRYEARAANLVVTDPTLLPDDTCGPADAVPKADAKGGPKSNGKSGNGRSGMSSKEDAIKNGLSEIPEGTITVYADGACSGNPGPAGLGVVILDGSRRIEISEYLGKGTNNIAELTAIQRALAEIDGARPAVIRTDSQYSIGVLQKGWKAKANVELVAELKAKLKQRRQTRLEYVPGHSNVLLNERADALARQAVTTSRSERKVYASKLPPAATSHGDGKAPAEGGEAAAPAPSAPPDP